MRLSLVCFYCLGLNLAPKAPPRWHPAFQLALWQVQQRPLAVMSPSRLTLIGLLALLAPAAAVLDPWSAGIAVGVMGGFSYVWNTLRDTSLELGVSKLRPIHAINCAMRECCDAPYVTRDVTRLRERLQAVVHGQHLVADTLPRVIANHVRNPRPRKPLVISMHGTTGVGKNYVSYQVAESLFQKGMQSRFVRLFVGGLHFPFSDPDSVRRYSDDLRRWVLGNLSTCAHSLFIFDEVDKIPAGVLSGIRSFMDFHGELHGVDLASATYLLLSNTGGKAINSLMMQRWREGAQREQTGLDVFQSVVAERAFSETGGLYRSDIVSAALVDLYLPFLPLERSHVRLCVLDELRRRGVAVGQEEAVEYVLKQVRFDREQQLFAKVGCKDVANKVNMVVDHSMFPEL